MTIYEKQACEIWFEIFLSLRCGYCVSHECENLSWQEHRRRSSSEEHWYECCSRIDKPLYRTGRGVTTDNFFTSIELSDRLWANGLTLLGTLRHNKPQIPASFLPSKRRDIHDSQFGFRREKTLVSYVPQKNKAVILLSTEHHSQKMILSNTGPEVISKPEIIGAYNATKGPVDTFDKLVSEYTCRRNTRRWTKNALFFLLDAAGYYAFVLEWSKLPQNFQRNKKRQRRLRLECLAEQLIAEQMKNRINN